MNKKLFTIFQMQEIANEMKADGYDCEFREDYSGRGMYGKTCVGFVVDDVFEIKYRVRDRGIKAKACEDNMGLSYIVYYPSISYPTE